MTGLREGENMVQTYDFMKHFHLVLLGDREDVLQIDINTLTFLSVKQTGAYSNWPILLKWAAGARWVCSVVNVISSSLAGPSPSGILMLFHRRRRAEYPGFCQRLTWPLSMLQFSTLAWRDAEVALSYHMTRCSVWGVFCSVWHGGTNGCAICCCILCTQD